MCLRKENLERKRSQSHEREREREKQTVGRHRARQEDRK